MFLSRNIGDLFVLNYLFSLVTLLYPTKQIVKIDPTVILLVNFV